MSFEGLLGDLNQKSHYQKQMANGLLITAVVSG